MTNNRLEAILVSDAKCGTPYEVIAAIEKYGFNVTHLSSGALLSGTRIAGNVLILDRCKSILPARTYKHFSLSFNCHPSMLPLHRGAHPIFWAALFEDPIGISLHTLSKSVDEGMIIYQKQIKYSEKDTFREIHTKTRAATLKGLSVVLTAYVNRALKEEEPRWCNNWHHINSFSDRMLQRLPLGWDSTVIEARERLKKEIEEYRYLIRYKHNSQVG